MYYVQKTKSKQTISLETYSSLNTSERYRMHKKILSHAGYIPDKDNLYNKPE